jgi:hypothetical protein
MLHLDEHTAKVAVDMHHERIRLQMGSPVPTRWWRLRARRRRFATLRTRSRALFDALGCRLADLACRLQQRERPALASEASARLGAWLSGRLEPQSECSG